MNFFDICGRRKDSEEPKGLSLENKYNRLEIDLNLKECGFQTERERDRQKAVASISAHKVKVKVKE